MFCAAPSGIVHGNLDLPCRTYLQTKPVEETALWSMHVLIDSIATFDASTPRMFDRGQLGLGYPSQSSSTPTRVGFQLARGQSVVKVRRIVAGRV